MTVHRHPAITHCRMLLDRRMVMGRRGRLIDRRPLTAHFRNSVRHRTAMCRRPTLTGRHPDAGTGRYHRVICCLLMLRLPVHRHARTSRRPTLTGHHRAMAYLQGTVQSTVRRHALLSLGRTQFRGRARTLAA
jgi:hypothetical protein